MTYNLGDILLNIHTRQTFRITARETVQETQDRKINVYTLDGKNRWPESLLDCNFILQIVK